MMTHPDVDDAVLSLGLVRQVRLESAHLSACVNSNYRSGKLLEDSYRPVLQVQSTVKLLEEQGTAHVCKASESPGPALRGLRQAERKLAAISSKQVTYQRASQWPLPSSLTVRMISFTISCRRNAAAGC